MSGLPPGGAGPLPALVSTDWLAQRLGRPGLRVLDASWYLPAAGRDPAAEYAAAHIQGALYFDLDAVSDHASVLPQGVPRVAIAGVGPLLRSARASAGRSAVSGDEPRL